MMIDSYKRRFNVETETDGMFTLRLGYGTFLSAIFACFQLNFIEYLNKTKGLDSCQAGWKLFFLSASFPLCIPTHTKSEASLLDLLWRRPVVRGE